MGSVTIGEEPGEVGSDAAPTVSRRQEDADAVAGNDRATLPVVGGRASLRARPTAIVLDGEDMAIKRRGPLLALHRHIEIAQCLTNVFLDLVQKNCG